MSVDLVEMQANLIYRSHYGRAADARERLLDLVGDREPTLPARDGAPLAPAKLTC